VFAGDGDKKRERERVLLRVQEVA